MPCSTGSRSHIAPVVESWHGEQRTTLAVGEIGTSGGFPPFPARRGPGMMPAFPAAGTQLSAGFVRARGARSQGHRGSSKGAEGYDPSTFSATVNFSCPLSLRQRLPADPADVTQAYVYDNGGHGDSHLTSLTYKHGTTTIGNLTYGEPALSEAEGTPTGGGARWAEVSPSSLYRGPRAATISMRIMR